MRRATVRFWATLVLIGTVATPALAAERARRTRPGHGKELQQVEQQIRAGRSVTRRIQRDPRASAEIKRQATELDELLGAREKMVAKLDGLYRDFLARHKAEIDELETIRKRALVIDAQLGQERDGLVQANRPDIDQLKQGSQRARELIEQLRANYDLDRRTRRGR